MKKVLVADDTKNIRLLLTKCLEHEGYGVETACDGPEALDAFMKTGYDLAFLDIKMPGLSGTEVLKRIREAGISTPVIVITAYGTVKNAVECTRLGAVTYLQKPFTAEKIKSVLNDLLDASKETYKADNVEISLERIRRLENSGLFRHAYELLKKVIPGELENPEVYFLLSKAYLGMGEREKGERFLRVYRIFRD